MNTIAKFQRGQVWWVKGQDSVGSRYSYSTDKTRRPDHSSVTAKDRPYLIVSCNVSNECSTIINCLAISTREPDEYPMHVHYRDTEGRPQQIQCEQIHTKSQSEFNNYMYCLTDDLMKKVDVALAHQIGVATGVETIGELLEYVDNMIQRKIELIKSQEKEHTSRIVSNTVLHIKSSLRELMKESIKESTTVGEILKLEEPKVNSTFVRKEIAHTESPKEVEEDQKSEVTTVILARTKTGRIRWTDDAMKMFCSDYDSQPIDQVVTKYGLKNRATAVNYRSLFRSKLR